MARAAGAKSKSGLFLIELILAILFFALSSAVCAQLFAKAHVLSAKSGDLTMAVNQAQSIAEAFQKTPEEGTLSENVGTVRENGVPTLYYDDAWRQCGVDSAIYRATVALREENSIRYAGIAVWKIGAEEPLYELETGKFQNQLSRD